VISAEWHPDDERLLIRYVEGPDAAVDRHLAWCVSCRRRLAALAADLDALYDAAGVDSGDAFDAERLALQRRSVQQRLGAAVPARVLSFPGAATTVGYLPFMRVAAAALLVAMCGAGLVRVAQMSESGSAVGIHTVAAQSAPIARLARDVPSDTVLEDIEMALAQPRTAELRALDALTPHVRDAVAPLR
jgi:hypothetical protein